MAGSVCYQYQNFVDFCEWIASAGLLGYGYLASVAWDCLWVCLGSIGWGTKNNISGSVGSSWQIHGKIELKGRNTTFCHSVIGGVSFSLASMFSNE
jgi:hypothetical protein